MKPVCNQITVGTSFIFTKNSNAAKCFFDICNAGMATFLSEVVEAKRVDFYFFFIRSKFRISLIYRYHFYDSKLPNKRFIWGGSSWKTLQYPRDMQICLPAYLGDASHTDCAANPMAKSQENSNFTCQCFQKLSQCQNKKIF